MRIETLAVHAGHAPDPGTGAVSPPIHLSTTFARDGAPVLRLVTCGGDFDFASHHYRSNVVVTAHPA